jgi:peptidoglycan/xylan/chitin deacetylase (PgdA/CDA1 family)
VTLLVEAPGGYEPERRYILDVILGDRLGLDWTLRTADRADVRISRADDPAGACVLVPDVLFATPEQDWLTAASMPDVRVVGGLPVLYGSAIAAGDPSVLHVDVFGSAFFMLTRYEELVTPDRDRYDRFPAAASVAGRAGFLGVPVVDAYVELLWDALRRAWPRLHRKVTGYEVLLTHDVDDPLTTLGHGPRDIARQFAGDLVRRRDPRLVGRRARALLGDRRFDPNNTFDLIMRVSECHGFRSAFYFLPYRDERPRDGPYLFEHAWVRSLIGRMAARGHEVGLHPSFCTYRDAARTSEELGRLMRVAQAEGVDQEEWGGRQHYLRWTNPETWRNWEAAGLSYDSTLGYAEMVGFRTGTCHPYRAFDLQDRRPLRLRERPFQVMDVTLMSTMALTPDAALEAVSAIAAECRRYRGCLGVLWHNNTLLRSAREQRWYETLVASIV